MRSPFLTRLALAAAVVVALLGTRSATPAVETKLWYKGNLHTHTTHSDGDSTPDEVARWYKENRYQFLILSDHNYLTEVTGLNGILAAPERFLLIPGEEVTAGFNEHPVHVNGYNLSRLVDPARGASLVETIQRNVDAIRDAGGLPSVNHPNFRWAFGSRELLQIRDCRLFEVYNGHPTVYNRGGGGGESLDEMWDVLLSVGRRIYGIAVDDAHAFKQFRKDLSNPGRGWVTVRASSLATAGIMAALQSGDFYASTGVELRDVSATASELRVEIKPAGDMRYTTKFIGEGGRVLKTANDTVAVYAFAGNEKYVRAKVEASNGDDAWVQPVFR